MRQTTGRWIARVLVPVGGLLAVLSLATPPAEASCAMPVPIARAVNSSVAAFVGTVTAADWQGRRVTVRVEDVWRGQVSTPAIVVGTPGSAKEITTVDRVYVVGTRYLFVPWAQHAGSWQDNGCSATQVYDAKLSTLRPAGAVRTSPTVAPRPSSSESTSPAGSREATGVQKDEPVRWVARLLAVAVATAGAALLVSWRRKRKREVGVPQG